MSELVYFAYGSNLLSERLRRRVPSARPIGPARLDGYAMRFNLYSGDGSAKCNIGLHEGAHVWGVAWTLPEAERHGLDRAEGLGFAYDDRTVPVTVAGAQRRALTYVGLPHKVGAPAAPYDWYKAFVLAGALEHGLRPEYVRQHVLAVEHVHDRDPARRRENAQILRQADVVSGASLPGDALGAALAALVSDL